MSGSTNDGEALLRLDHVTKRFDKVVAVDDLDLAVNEGQFLTFLGPSGCGKSTTLRMLGGFETPTRGRIVLANNDITNTPPNRRDVNMVFQDYALFPHMNVERNIAFGLELKGRTKSQIGARIDSLTEFLGLGDLRDRLPEQLSGGQRQRVALARALAPDPKVLLLDEPLGALDAKLRSQVQVELKAIQQRTGKTFVFVTHDQEEALSMSDRIIVMNCGRVEQDGTPEDLYQKPASRFVADFIGEANLLECIVMETGAGYALLDWCGNQIKAAVIADAPVDGARVTAALRPENIVCTERERSLPQTAKCRVRGHVQRRIFKGAVVTLEVAVDTQQADAPLRATLDPATAEAIQGPQVWLGWQPERLAILKS